MCIDGLECTKIFTQKTQDETTASCDVPRAKFQALGLRVLSKRRALYCVIIIGKKMVNLAILRPHLFQIHWNDKRCLNSAV